MHGVQAGACLGFSSEGSCSRLIVAHKVREVPHIQHALHCVRLASACTKCHTFSTPFTVASCQCLQVTWKL